MRIKTAARVAYSTFLKGGTRERGEKKEERRFQ